MFAKPIRGIHVFWMVFTFFAVIVATDVLFIVNAVRSFPGEEVKNSYVLGLAFNSEAAFREKQAKLGWTAQAGLRDEGGSMLVVRMARADASPLAGLSIAAGYHVAGTGGEMRRLVLIERQPGEYAAPFPVEGPAHVELSIEARRSAQGEPVFEAAKSLVIS
jgi:nitrogen fixation protein FixH